jgi:hypothetical protein
VWETVRGCVFWGVCVLGCTHGATVLVLGYMHVTMYFLGSTLSSGSQPVLPVLRGCL